MLYNLPVITVIYPPIICCRHVRFQDATKAVVTLIPNLLYFSYAFFSDLQVRRNFYQNESDFRLEETKRQNFVRIPSGNFHNGLNDIVYSIDLN